MSNDHTLTFTYERGDIAVEDNTLVKLHLRCDAAPNKLMPELKELFVNASAPGCGSPYRWDMVVSKVVSELIKKYNLAFVVSDNDTNLAAYRNYETVISMSDVYENSSVENVLDRINIETTKSDGRSFKPFFKGCLKDYSQQFTWDDIEFMASCEYVRGYQLQEITSDKGTERVLVMLNSVTVADYFKEDKYILASRLLGFTMESGQLGAKYLLDNDFIILENSNLDIAKKKLDASMFYDDNGIIKIQDEGGL